MPRTIFIGDVHGCRDELAELLALLQPSPGKDRVIFVGDLVDKGPDSLGVLRDVQRFLRTVPGSVVVAGNHEEKALRFQKSGKLDKLIDGHEDRAWALEAEDSDWAFIESMPLTWYDAGLNVRVIHGGIFPSLLERHPDAFEKIDARGPSWHRGGGKVMDRARRMLRVRFVGGPQRPEKMQGQMLALGENVEGDPFWADVYDGSAGFVVYGHSPFLDGQIRVNPDRAVGIDTGCVFGVALTAYVIDVLEDGSEIVDVVQVEARKRYAEPLEED